MKTTIKLSDLVMLQMMGYLDDYVDELVTNTDKHDKVIEKARKRASTPKVFEEIVNKSIKAQFGESYTIVRELAQNGKDSYAKKESPKKVKFLTSSRDNLFILSARDYGAGMSPIEMIRNLLIPYNSGKDKDSEKIGEHGIGWYSIMDFAKIARVISSKNGIRTKATVQKHEGEWQATIETSKGNIKGTKVTAFANPYKADDSEIRRQLHKNIGLCDSTDVNISLNGIQVNKLADHYKIGGQVSVQYKDSLDTLDLYFRRDYLDNKSEKVIFTQDGLFIKDEEIPFAEHTIYNFFMKALTIEGFKFWIDIPTNVGLTKGRNNIVARDRVETYKAIIPTFEQCILDVVLEDDDLIKKLDRKMSYWIREILSDSYKLEIKKKENPEPNMIVRIVDYYKNKINSKKEDEESNIKIKGNDDFKDLTLPEVTDQRKKKLEEAAKKYYEEMSDFSKKIFKKRFIPAMKYIKGESENIKVSISDMVMAYVNDILFDSRWHDGEKTDGIYVNSSSDVVHTVLQQLDLLQNQRKKTLAAITAPAKEKKKAPKKDSITEIVNRTNIKKIKEITAKENVGYEYQAFLEIANYVDGIISKANRLVNSPVMIHYNERMLMNVEIAHTDRKGISFNLADDTAYSFIEKVRRGEFDFDSMLKLADVLVHEKAHCKRSEYDATPEHGRKFYEVDKVKVRSKFITYCLKNGVDALEYANDILKRYDCSIETPPKDFGDLIEKYSKPEEVKIKTKKY